MCRRPVGDPWAVVACMASGSQLMRDLLYIHASIHPLMPIPLVLLSSQTHPCAPRSPSLAHRLCLCVNNLGKLGTRVSPPPFTPRNLTPAYTLMLTMHTMEN